MVSELGGVVTAGVGGSITAVLVRGLEETPVIQSDLITTYSSTNKSRDKPVYKYRTIREDFCM